MTRRAVTLQHAVAVAKNFDTVVAVKAATFGIGDAFVRLQCCLFCAGRQFNGFIRGNFRRVEQIEIRCVKGQQLFVCHAGTGIWRGITGNIQRRLYSTGNGLRA